MYLCTRYAPVAELVDALVTYVVQVRVLLGAQKRAKHH